MLIHTMKIRTTLVSLLAVAVLLFFKQVAKAEIPFVLSYFDSTWHSVQPTIAEYNQMAAMGINVANDSYNGINLNYVQAAGMKVRSISMAPITLT